MRLLLLLLITTLSFAADFTFTGSTNYYRTNEVRYENRLNIVSFATYGPSFYFGDFILNQPLGEPYFDKRQFKNMLGINLTNGISVRYQNDDFYDEKLVNNVIKPKTFNEDRIGLGYKFNTKISTVTITNDFMFLKSNLADRRSEWNISIASSKTQIKHQLWYDYINGHVSGWYEKLIIGYKITPTIQIQIRNEWQLNKKRVDMIGLGILY